MLSGDWDDLNEHRKISRRLVRVAISSYGGNSLDAEVAECGQDWVGGFGGIRWWDARQNDEDESRRSSRGDVQRVSNCMTVVPKSWGDFKGGSQYGLAFEDDKGVVRFVQHPSCGDINSSAEPPVESIDLEIRRR